MAFDSEKKIAHDRRFRFSKRSDLKMEAGPEEDWGGFNVNQFLKTMSKGNGVSIIRSSISPQLAAKTRLQYNPLGQLRQSC